MAKNESHFYADMLKWCVDVHKYEIHITVTDFHTFYRQCFHSGFKQIHNFICNTTPHSVWPYAHLADKPSGPVLCLINKTPSAIGI